MNNPRTAVATYITAQFSIDNWTTVVNDGWFEVIREKEPQIYLPTDDEKYINKTTHVQRDLDRQTSPIIKDSDVFVYVSAYDKETRNLMLDEMVRIFELSDARNPEDGVDYIYIVHDYPQDKDKKKGCSTWVQIFEIKVLF